MRLVTYRTDHGRASCGVAVDGLLYPARELARAAKFSDASSSVCETTRGVLGLGPESWSALAAAAESGAAAPAGELEAAQLLAPVTDPQKIICMGLNYRDHADETGMEAPTTPIVFAKYPNSLVGPTDSIVLPPASERVDYEAELAVVIGQRCRDVSELDALGVVAGAMAFNDVSARDLQMRTSQWTIGKAIDTFAPCGPWLVSLDEIGNIQSLGIATRVNGHTVQDGTTASMIFTVAETIAFLSQLMTLEPGDIIATGTPAGVGYTRNPPVLLQPGDVVEIEVEGIGLLRNPVVAAADGDLRAEPSPRGEFEPAG